MKKIQLFLVAIVVVIFFGCASFEKDAPNALAYNEVLIKEIAVVDSVRGFIGDKEDESIVELNADLDIYKKQVSSSIETVININYKKDTLFKNAVLKYLLLNKGFSEIDYPNMIKLKTKLESPNSNKEEIYGLMYSIFEKMSFNLEKSIKQVESVQTVFASKHRLTLK